MGYRKGKTPRAQVACAFSEAQIQIGMKSPHQASKNQPDSIQVVVVLKLSAGDFVVSRDDGQFSADMLGVCRHVQLVPTGVQIRLQNKIVCLPIEALFDLAGEINPSAPPLPR